MPKVFLSDADKSRYQLRRFVAQHTGETFRYRTKADLADAIGIAHTTFCRKLSGKSEFTLPELLKLFQILHASNDDVCLVFLSKKRGA